MTPQETFTSDKSNWFIETENNLRIWDISLVSNFWKLLKIHKVDKGDYNFENFVFPSFSKENMGELNMSQSYFVEIFAKNRKLIDKPVTFKNCRFQDGLFFLGNIAEVINYPDADVIFLKDLKFENCNFERKFRFQAQKIGGNLIIDKCNFFGKSNILFSHFYQDITIRNSNFKNEFSYTHNKNKGKTSISSNIFDNKFHSSSNIFESHFAINTAEINGKTTIHSNSYKTYGSIAYVLINNQSIFKNETYDNFQFQDVEFSSKSHIMENIEFSEKGILTFRNQIFSNNVVIRNCDCTKMRFLNSDISEVKFSSCKWKINERLILLNEDELNIKETNDIQNIEYLYRQLKRNFENDLDWELAGKAYVSEMHFRKIRLGQDKNYFSWFIYWFYGVFGGYTLNYSKPIIWFLLFTFIFFPSYYLFFENIDGDYSSIFKKSISASAPWIQTNLNYENWSVLALQKTLSIILLAFIILALRKRFKE